jgi:ParB/RepB/Spo0J family partition protein
MAKLPMQQSAAGFNAGKNIYAKMMRISDIVIDPEISKIFDVRIIVKDEVLLSIKTHGFYIDQPVTVYKRDGQYILVDGHTRYAAAKEAGLDEIPVTEKEFASKEEAILYAFERQVIRRNLTQNEMFLAVELLPFERNGKGMGNKAKELAERLRISQSQIHKIKKIQREGSPEVIEAVRSGEMSVKKGYETLAPEIDIPAFDNCSEITPSKIIKEIFMILAEANQLTSIELLISHYFSDSPQHVKDAFLKPFPDDIRETLAKLFQNSL